MTRLTLLVGAALLVAGCPGDKPPIGDRFFSDALPDGFVRRDGPGLEWRLLEPLPPGEFGLSGCKQSIGNRFQLSFMVQQISIDATEVKAEKGSLGLIGVSGSTTDGYRFWFGREGDPDAAAYTESKSYPATKSPYHVMLQRWPSSSGAACAGNAQCVTYYGLNGYVLFQSIASPAQGNFNISAVATKAGCWVDQPSGPPVLTNCGGTLGQFYGCFKAN